MDINVERARCLVSDQHADVGKDCFHLIEEQV